MVESSSSNWIPCRMLHALAWSVFTLNHTWLDWVALTLTNIPFGRSKIHHFDLGEALLGEVHRHLTFHLKATRKQSASSFLLWNQMARDLVLDVENWDLIPTSTLVSVKHSFKWLLTAGHCQAMVCQNLPFNTDKATLHSRKSKWAVPKTALHFVRHMYRPCWEVRVKQDGPGISLSLTPVM